MRGVGGDREVLAAALVDLHVPPEVVEVEVHLPYQGVHPLYLRNDIIA